MSNDLPPQIVGSYNWQLLSQQNDAHAVVPTVATRVDGFE